jgi:hypothetical protein
MGYSWTKNDALFQSDPNVEMWEDLYPDGSILRINNIQVNQFLKLPGKLFKYLFILSEIRRLLVRRFK